MRLVAEPPRCDTASGAFDLPPAHVRGTVNVRIPFIRFTVNSDPVTHHTNDE